MLFRREKTRCPKCNGERARASKWHSREEKARHPGLRPMRCEDCGNRFLVAADGEAVSSGLIGVGAGAMALVVAAVVITGVQRPDPPKEDGAQAISLTITPEAMKAAENGDPEAQFTVASSMLSDAELNLAYSSTAIRFLQQAAEHGHTRAMLRLGQLHRRGVGALQNFDLAAKWIDSAARRGEPQAMLELGRLYREGVGMPRDLVEAYIWLNRAAAAHDPIAAHEREEVARVLSSLELRRAQEESSRDDILPKQPVGPRR